MRIRISIIYLAVAGLVCLPASARADEFTFSYDQTSGTVQGTVTGTIDLSFVSPGGSGNGAADSLVLTSIPPGYGSFVSNNVTTWADQIENTFTVVNGTITDFSFFAATNTTGNANLLCLNGAGETAGVYVCPTSLNELQSSDSLFGYNFGGFAAVTFAEAATEAAVPEPGSAWLLGTGLAGLVFGLRKRFC
jgi:PEP-CTERM motif